MDLNTERRKRLQEEIEELEKNLEPGGATLIDAMSECSLDTDSGSEDDTNAELDFLFQMDEGIEDGKSDDNEDLEKNLPENPETCLQINLVYQEVIEEKIREVELLIAQNKQQQEELMWEFAGSKMVKARDAEMSKANIYLGHFLKPYFKDKATGVGPPSNEDSKEKKAQGIKSFDELLVRKWKAEEKTLLKNSVVSDCLQRTLQPKLFKLEYLNQKLGSAKSAMENKIVEKQIKETEKDIEDLNLITEGVLMGTRSDEHDWEKIANINFEGTRKPEQIRKFWQNSEHPTINKKTWSENEEEKLKEIAEEHNYVNWQTIAEKLGTNRTAFQCLQKYQSYNKDFKRKEWTKEEDNMLLQLVQEMRVGNFIPYKKMAYYMEGRNSMQLLHRWSKSVNPSLKKGYWTPEEDALLLKAVAKFGERDWYKIRSEVPGRSDSQCRDRFLKGINQRLKKGKWSPEEEAKFVELIEKYGVGHWAKIASELPGRTDSQCLSKWKFMIGYKKKKSRLIKQRQKRRRRKKLSSSSSEDNDEEALEPSSDEELETYNKRRNARFIVPNMDLWVPTKATSAELQKAPMRRSISKGSIDQNCPSAQGSAVRVSSKLASEVSDPHTEASSETNTVLKGISYSYITDVSTKDPTELLKTVSKGGKKMLQVTLNDVKKILRRNTHSRQKKFMKQLKRPQVSTSSRIAVNEPAGQEPTVQHHALERPCRERKSIPWKKTIDRNLLMAVTPWVGNVILPYTLNHMSLPENRTQADKIKDQLQNVNLNSSPIFALLIQLFQIDAAGCLKVIRERKVRQSELLRTFAGSVAPQQTSCSSQDASDCTEQNHSQQSIFASQSGTSKQNKTKPRIQRENWAFLPAAQPCPRRPSVPKERRKTVSELLREKRSRESMNKTTTERAIILTPQMMVIQQPTHQEAAQPVTHISCHPSHPAKRLLPTLSPTPVSSATFMPFQNKVAAVHVSAEDPSSSQESSMRSSGNLSVGKAMKTSSHLSGVAPHQGSTTVQVPGSGAASSPLQNPAHAAGQILATPPLDITFPLKDVPKAGAQVALAVSTPIQPPQQNPVHLLPTLVASQGGPCGVPSNVLPITWVLTAQGLIPVSLKNVGGIPSHNGKGESAPINNKSSTISSNAEMNAVTVLPVSIVKPSVSCPGPQSAQISDEIYASNLSLQDGSVHSPSLPLHVALFNTHSGSAGTLPSLATSAGYVSSLTSVSSSAIRTMSSSTSLEPSLLCAHPELPSANLLTIDTSEELRCSLSGLSAIPDQDMMRTDCIAQNPYQLPSASGRVEQLDGTVGESILVVPEAVQHPNIPPNPMHSNSEKDSLDSSLISLEEEELVKKWLKGEQGVQMPVLINPLPYLPPSVCTLKMLSRLLLQKKTLEEKATSLLSSTGESQKKSFQQKLQVVRDMVEQRLKDNPAYIHLKVRFLAMFTFPAFLATLTPPEGKTTVPRSNRRYANTGDTDTDEKEDVPEETESSNIAVENEVAEMQLDDSVEHQLMAFGATASHESVTPKEVAGKDSNNPETISYPMDAGDEIPPQSRRSARLRKRKCLH